MRKSLFFMLALVSINTAVAQQATPTDTIARDLLQALAPSGLAMTQLKVDGTRITVEGSAPQSTVISQFMRQIDESPQLDRVELVQIQNVDGAMRFTLAASADCLADGNQACGAPARPSKPSVYKCVINGVVSFQATPCPTP